MHRWDSPHLQHDAGEFIHFLGGALALDAGLGLWQSRHIAATLDLPVSQTQVADHGEMFPLVLQHAGPHAASAQPISLQQLFVAWRNQADRHAAVTLPPLLPVQISRFTSTGLKVQFPVKFSEAVYVPFFEDLSLRTSSHRYLLAAVIYHIGESRSHGHYKTALFHRGQLTHVTDDNCRPCPAHPADVHTAANNAYIFILCRDAARQEASAAR